MAELGSKIASAIRSKEPFKELKRVITDKYSISTTKLFGKYIKQQFVNNQLPSVFLTTTIKDLETLQPGITNNKAFLRDFFLNSLPQKIHSIISVSNSEDVHELARIADRVSCTFRDQEMNTQPSNNALQSSESIAEQISTLSQRLNKIQPINQPELQNTHSTQHLEHTLICFYHRKFADSANYCCLGCTWKNKKQSIQTKTICIYHNLFGNRALRCLTGCTHAAQNQEDIISRHQKN